MSCRHKTYLDHSKGSHENVRIWRCSSCGTESPWSEDWSYYGKIECQSCGVAEIETVACPVCNGSEVKA